MTRTIHRSLVNRHKHAASRSFEMSLRRVACPHQAASSSSPFWYRLCCLLQCRSVLCLPYSTSSVLPCSALCHLPGLLSYVDFHLVCWFGLRSRGSLVPWLSFSVLACCLPFFSIPSTKLVCWLDDCMLCKWIYIRFYRRISWHYFFITLRINHISTVIIMKSQLI